MNSTTYVFPAEIPFDPLLTRLVAAEDRMARLDEKLSGLPFSTGFAERLLYGEASAVMHGERALVHVEDLVMLDGGAFTGAMSPELSSAWHLLGLWRKALHGDAARYLASDSPGELIEGVRQAGPMDVPYWGEAERLESWRRVLRKSTAYPPLLAAVLVADAWLVLEPEQRRAWKAWLVASLVLRARGKCTGWLLPMATGVRFGVERWHAGQSFVDRMKSLLGSASASIVQCERDLQRLELAYSMMSHKIRGCRSHAKVTALVDLLLARPFVSVPMAAKALKCSRQSVGRMLPMLGSAPREMTGNKRYRVWMV